MKVIKLFCRVLFGSLSNRKPVEHYSPELCCLATLTVQFIRYASIFMMSSKPADRRRVRTEWCGKQKTPGVQAETP